MNSTSPSRDVGRFRKLRIAWSVAWGLACMLLIVLWVRSYWRWDVVGFYTPATDSFALESFHGRLFIVGSAVPNQFITYSIPAPTHSDLDSYGNEFGFGFAIWPTWGYAGAPYYFLVVCSVAMSLAPWIKYSWRFSLRSLLIATTLVAVVLGLAVWAASRF